MLRSLQIANSIITVLPLPVGEESTRLESELYAGSKHLLWTALNNGNGNNPRYMSGSASLETSTMPRTVIGMFLKCEVSLRITGDCGISLLTTGDDASTALDCSNSRST